MLSQTISRPKLLIGFLALVGVVLGASASASAALPVYDGDMTFQDIHGPSGPEEYSWEVELGPGQVLEQIDDQQAEVYYNGGHAAFGISAEPAHDADGSNVPTTLGVSGENVITLTVHYRAGNPAAGGALFVYPIVAGAGWEGGFHTEIVQGPPDEMQLREERERQARERHIAAIFQAACLVPKLNGRRFTASKKRVAQAGCRIGRVRRINGTVPRSARVVGQNPKPGTILPPGGSVQVTLVV